MQDGSLHRDFLIVVVSSVIPGALFARTRNPDARNSFLDSGFARLARAQE
jgi:hypothetical protein